MLIAIKGVLSEDLESMHVWSSFWDTIMEIENRKELVTLNMKYSFQMNPGCDNTPLAARNLRTQNAGSPFRQLFSPTPLGTSISVYMLFKLHILESKI